MPIDISLFLSSLSITMSKSIHVATNGVISFFIILSNIHCVCVYIYIYIYIYRYTTSLSISLSVEFRLLNEHYASLVAQTVKRLPAMRETWVRSLGGEDPLEKEMATHSSILAWKIPWTEETGRLQSMRAQRVRHD